MDKRQQLSWIDGMKGIAICGTVMVHCNTNGLPTVLTKMIDLGRYGVQIFFVLSAYLTFLSLNRFYTVNRTKSEIFLWVIAKYIKLIPLYYFAIILYWCIKGGSVYWLGNEGHITIGNAIAHFLLIHGLFPHYANSILAVEWYLGVLVIFYVIAPFLYKKIDSLGKAIVLWIFSTIGGNVIYKLIYIIYPIVEDEYIYKNFFKTFCFNAQFPVIVCGIILFFLNKKNDTVVKSEKAWLSYSLFFISIWMIAGIIFGKNVLWGINTYTLFGISFLILAYSQQMYSCKLIDNKIFNYLGKHSYEIYLFHFLVIYGYDKYINVDIGNAIANWGIKFLIILISAIVVSYPLKRLNDFINSKWNTFFYVNIMKTMS